MRRGRRFWSSECLVSLRLLEDWPYPRLLLSYCVIPRVLYPPLRESPRPLVPLPSVVSGEIEGFEVFCSILAPLGTRASPSPYSETLTRWTRVNRWHLPLLRRLPPLARVPTETSSRQSSQLRSLNSASRRTVTITRTAKSTKVVSVIHSTWP